MEIKDVEALANLSRIELSDKEKHQMLHDMQGILEYVKQIESIKIDGENVEHSVFNIWREDEIKERDFSPELIVGQFPDAKDGFLKVKKIL